MSHYLMKFLAMPYAASNSEEYDQTGLACSLFNAHWAAKGEPHRCYCGSIGVLKFVYATAEGKTRTRFMHLREAQAEVRKFLGVEQPADAGPSDYDAYQREQAAMEASLAEHEAKVDAAMERDAQNHPPAPAKARGRKIKAAAGNAA